MTRRIPKFLSKIFFSYITTAICETIYPSDRIPAKGADSEYFKTDFKKETNSISRFLSKRWGSKNDFAAMVDTLVRRMTELNLQTVESQAYFQKLKRKGTEREIELIMKCKHNIFPPSASILANIAYRGRGLDAEAMKVSRDTNQIHGFVYESELGYILLGTIDGSRNWLPDTRHSRILAHELKIRTHEAFIGTLGQQLRPECYLRNAWNLLNDSSGFGGVTALFVTITHTYKIRLANLGGSWARLYRDGKLIFQSLQVLHADGSSYHLCKTHGLFKPKYDQDTAHDSEKYEWRARARDVFIIVSISIQEILSTVQIYNFSKSFQKTEELDEQFIGASVGIIQGARAASPDAQNNEKLALAVKFR